MNLIIYKHRVYKLIESGDKLMIEPAEFILPSDLNEESNASVEVTRLISA